MSFDFVSYIAQQLEQKYPSLLIDESKITRKHYLVHLLSLQLLKLADYANQDNQNLYEKIQNLDHSWLAVINNNHIFQDNLAKTFFQPILKKLQDINLKIAEVIMLELSQLDHNTDLNATGIQQLLNDQYIWVQAQVDNWFWDSIQRPEFKSPTEEILSTEHITKEFNHMSHQHTHQDHLTTTNKTQIVDHLPATFYLMINPLVAAVICFILYKNIL